MSGIKTEDDEWLPVIIKVESLAPIPIPSMEELFSEHGPCLKQLLFSEPIRVVNVNHSAFKVDVEKMSLKRKMEDKDTATPSSSSSLKLEDDTRNTPKVVIGDPEMPKLYKYGLEPKPWEKVKDEATETASGFKDPNEKVEVVEAKKVKREDSCTQSSSTINVFCRTEPGVEKQYWCKFCDRLWKNFDILLLHIKRSHRSVNIKHLNRFNYATFDLPVSKTCSCCCPRQ